MRFRIVMSGTKTWKLFWGMRMWCFLNGAFHNVLDVTLRILLAIKSIHAWNQIYNQRYKSHPQSVAVLPTQIVRKTSGKRRGNTPSPPPLAPIHIPPLAHPHRCHGANTTQTRRCRRVVPKRAERAPKGYQKGTKTNRIHPTVLQAVATNVTTHARFIITHTFPTTCRLINTIHAKRGEKKPKKLLLNRPQPHVSLGIPHPWKNIFIANKLLYSALRNKFRNLRKKYLPEWKMVVSLHPLSPEKRVLKKSERTLKILEHEIACVEGHI